ncbi:ABC transporter A family member 10-like [Oryza brachyantha]|uniref:ABC transporter A family member 10-like n=1 Tax=Oryza brachyantha TaxID=4533 RepID=UPI001ADD5193|nr:ABC transporter A family member 10-like [Oryza brachyantha]
MGASRLAQTNALFRKNLVIQRRAGKTNCCVILFPLLLFSVIGGLQIAINIELSRGLASGTGSAVDCRCSSGATVDANATGGLDCPPQCPLPRAPKWPPVLQIPRPDRRAVRDGDLFPSAGDLPDASCRAAGSCAASFLVTGSNRSFVASMMDNMLPVHNSSVNLSSDISALADYVLVDDKYSFFGFGVSSFLQNTCSPNQTLSFAYQSGNRTETVDVQCTQGLMLWRDSSWLINDELYRGYYQGNNKNKTNEIAAAYDFLSSDHSNFNVFISYNSTKKFDAYEGGITLAFNQEGAWQAPRLVQVPRLINMASNAYLHLRASTLKMSFDFVKEMPKAAQNMRPFDISSLIGQLPYVWTMELLFPVILTNIVYEKQEKLRIMMKMHGLGDLSYWTISYCYFFLLSLLYVMSFTLFGSVLGLRFFRLNDYSLQFVYYSAYMNLQISFAFLMATCFSSVRTATVTGYFYIIGSGLLGELLFRSYVEDVFLSRSWITLLELFPAFSLYRIIYEFAQSALLGDYMNSSGMKWIDLSDPKNGMRSVLTIMILEWFLFLLLAFYLDHFGSFQNGIRKAALLFHSHVDKNRFQATQQTIQLQEFKASIDNEKTDVIQERETVEHILQESNNSCSVICDNLRKVYRGTDGNAKRVAVRGLSLSIPRGQCFGVLGPNGAGKTTLINMLTGFTKPTSGTAYIEGLDIQFEMNKIYAGIGVCPQHDLLWETLTGREHLMFYGRLKNLRGVSLTQAIEKSLKSVRLFAGGVADKLVGKYSGGMKRRLSVAISLIGDPKVVYMDEPSSGLDPASRKDLWNAVKSAKQDRAIILTTHSMEEAEALCDRIGIIANGSLQCIGNSKELKAKYGGSYVLTVTTVTGEAAEEEMRRLVQSISPAMNRVYSISGTQKFEMPKQEVRISQVFQAMEHAKSRMAVLAWGLADTTLEDVFIRVARESDSASSSPLA